MNCAVSVDQFHLMIYFLATGKITGNNIECPAMILLKCRLPFPQFYGFYCLFQL